MSHERNSQSDLLQISIAVADLDFRSDLYRSPASSVTQDVVVIETRHSRSFDDETTIYSVTSVPPRTWGHLHHPIVGVEIFSETGRISRIANEEDYRDHAMPASTCALNVESSISRHHVRFSLVN